MFCPNCGTEQLKGTAYCSVCGAELPKIKESSENIETFPPPNDLPNVNLNKNKAQFIENQGMPNQMPNMGMQQMPYPNQMPNMGMQQMPYPNQMPNMGMQQMQYPNQMPNMGMPMQHPNQIPNMGMPMQYPNQMPNMGMQQMQYPNQIPNMGMQQMPNQHININITNKHNEPKKTSKNKFIASALAFFFGGLGAHKFYLGKYGWGIAYALFPFFSFIIAMAADSPEIGVLCTLPYFASFVESMMYLCMSNEDFQKKF